MHALREGEHYIDRENALSIDIGSQGMSEAF